MAISKINTNSIAPSQTLVTPVISGLMDLQGGQIKFPPSQVSSSDANTLDDYEEGTWTPTLNFSGGSTGITYNLQNGSYVKIGRLVYLTARIGLTNKGSSTGSARFAGIPFTPAAPAGNEIQVGNVWYTAFNNGSNYSINCRTDMVQAFIELRGYAGGSEAAVDLAWFNNNSSVSFSIYYETST